MKSFTLLALPLSLAGTLLSAFAGPWPNWRGPAHDNIAPDRSAPTSWDKSKNVRWRVELPDAGNSSPIVWGNRVLITQATEKDGRRQVMCFDRRTGDLLWAAGPTYNEKETKHETNTHCAASPVTDGKRVIASFASAGVFCFDMDGKELWRADLGPQNHIWGQGSSPVLHGELCIVYHGPGTPSIVYALDKNTGRKVWETAIPEVQPKERFDGFAGKSGGAMGSFATPLPVQAGSRTEIILPAGNKVLALDPASGKELWRGEDMNPLVYSSASFGEGHVVAMGGFFGSAMALKPGGNGDVSKDRLWYEQRAKKHRIGSPIIKGGHIYIANTDGTAECLDLATGKPVWMERLPATGSDGETWGSMVLIGDKLYVVNHSGDTFILRAAPKFEILAINSVGERSNSTLAVSDGELFLRTHAALYCISDTK